MKRNFTLSLLAIIVILGSCKKDDTNTDSATIQGTYQFKYISAKTNSTVTGSDGEKAVTTSDYTTINNQGTIVFDASNLSGTGLTYTVNDEAASYFYQDNQLLDSISYPFTFTYPASNSTAAYKLIGADSIYFAQGALVTGVGVTGSAQYISNGGRYTLKGNLLTITQIALKDSTFQDSGVTFHMRESGVANIVMEKQ